MILKLGMQHRGLKLYKVYISSDPGLTLSYFTVRSNLALMLLYGKKVKQWIFQKLLSSMI